METNNTNKTGAASTVANAMINRGVKAAKIKLVTTIVVIVAIVGAIALLAVNPFGWKLGWSFDNSLKIEDTANIVEKVRDISEFTTSCYYEEYIIKSEVNPWKFYHKRGAVGQASTKQFNYSTSQQFYIITGRKVKVNTLPTQEKTINKRYRQAVKDSLTQPHADDIRTWQKYGEKKKISKLNEQLNDQADAIMKTRKSFTYSKEQTDFYANIGGAPSLDGLYTVFGEIIEGMDVVEAISNVPATGTNRRPNPDVKIIKAYVLEDYQDPASK